MNILAKERAKDGNGIAEVHEKGEGNNYEHRNSCPHLAKDE